MNTFKNLVIALLTGLLALSLFSQPAQSAPKTYDAVKLIKYNHCLNFYDIPGNGGLKYGIEMCVAYEPK